MSGTPAVFVRFSGCNLRCSFCDTQHEDGREMSDRQIVDEINNYHASWIILTGGEPSLHIDSGFIRFLKEKTGKLISIETNGSRPIPPEIDWVTVSPKQGIGNNEDYEIKAERADEIKVVDMGQELEVYKTLPCVTGKTEFRLQPCFVEDPDQFAENISSTVSRVLENPEWKLSIQLHRFLGIQ